MLPPINHTQNISTSRHIHGMNAGAGIIASHFFYSFFSFWNQRQIVATNFQALRASGAMERFF
jgi:hypothetical protein